MDILKDCNGCDRVSDNRAFNCPPKMADGRLFTDYRPRCMAQSVPPATSHHDYRQHLIKNADKIMLENMRAAYTVNACGPCVAPYNVGTMLPEREMTVCDAVSCKTVHTNDTGVGRGRVFTMSEEDQQRRTHFIRQKEAEQAVMSQEVNCCGTTADNLDYYPWNQRVPAADPSVRNTVPSGAPMMAGGRSVLAM